MDMSAPNALNRSMQGLWSTHRRKVNLNVTPAISTSTMPIEIPLLEEASTSNASVGDNGASVSGAMPALKAADMPSVSDSPSQLTNGKRKVRSSRTVAGEENSKRTKLGSGSAGSSKDYSPPTTRLSDLGGIDACVEKMLELVAMPLCHPEVYLHTGVQPPRGVLLHGPPGCGKTMLAHAMAGELGLPFISISAPSIVSGMSGESEKTLRDTFEEAKRVAPCLLFIDEIDAITPKRESAQREMERRIVAQFLTCMDDLAWDKTENKPVIVMGATNRPDSLDVALRRAGRFDHEISMGVPDEEARAQILRILCSKLRLEGAYDFLALAKATPGYVGADLAALTGAAGIIAVKRIFRQLSKGTLAIPPTEISEPRDVADHMMSVDTPTIQQTPAPALTEPSAYIPPILFSSMLPTALRSPTASSIIHFLQAHPDPLTEAQLAPLCVTHSDFLLALKEVQPSSKREGFATIPDVTWSEIGALHGIREELHMAIVQPIKRPELFMAVGIEAGCGVLMWGPPGCGKTLLAKAVANESKANFISVKGPELLNKYVGESERAVRQVFTRARASAPCVVFFDELDALVPRRDDALSESSSRVVNTLLTELDGLDSRKGVYVLAATNRPDMIDPAMCRPGRLDKLLYVDLPSADERAEIITTVTRKVPLGEDKEGLIRQEIEALVRDRCEGYSGADLAAVVREAGVIALRRRLGCLEDLEPADEVNGIGDGVATLRVEVSDFVQAINKTGPSVSTAQRRRYAGLRDKFAGLPVTGGQKRHDEAEKQKD